MYSICSPVSVLTLALWLLASSNIEGNAEIALKDNQRKIHRPKPRDFSLMGVHGDHGDGDHDDDHDDKSYYHSSGEPSHAPTSKKSFRGKPSATPSVRMFLPGNTMPTSSAPSTIAPSVMSTIDPSCSPSTAQSSSSASSIFVATMMPTVEPSTSPSTAQLTSSTPSTIWPTMIPTTAPTSSSSTAQASSSVPSIVVTTTMPTTASTSSTVPSITAPSFTPSTVTPSTTVKPKSAAIAPSRRPTIAPTIAPTVSPSLLRSRRPSTQSSPNSTVSPMITPTIDPSISPTQDPTIKPTVAPTKVPPTIPTRKPSKSPSSRPSSSPTNTLSRSPDGGSLCPTTAEIPITYRGGSIMLGTTPIYIIWYGAWATSQQVIVRDFFNNVTDSDWLKIQSTYYQEEETTTTAAATLSTSGNKSFASASIKLVGETIDSYSQGTSISDISPVVKYALDNQHLAVDPQGIYFVAVSSDVAFAGFCSSFCGFHSAFDYSGKTLRHVMVGNDVCCAAQDIGPNGDAGVDGMITVIAHELTETITNSDGAWFDDRGYENADKCAWLFGSTYPTANGASANMKIGTRDYLVQQNWIVDSNQCCMTGYSQLS